MKKIAIYGKGGIGKSTVASTLSAALSVQGYRVMQIGCDPKADSTLKLTGGTPVTPVMSYLREHGTCHSLDAITVEGFNGVVCVEAGGPTPGLGCAGRGIVATFDVLEDLHAFDVHKPDFVLFDVLGDVVCGGFAMPLRKGRADEVVVVTSGEAMSLFVARNIKAALDGFAERDYAQLKGLVLNRRDVPDESQKVGDFAREIGTDILGDIPRDEAISRYEARNQTVIEGDPDLPVARAFLELARRVAAE